MSTENTHRFPKRIALALAAASAVGLVAAPSRALAHCDTLDGPVVKAAQAALEKRDPSLVLLWVKKDVEPEVTAAFRKTLAVRGASAEARQLADTWFLETVVRLHRAGEGAPYDGLKPAGSDLPHAVVAADRALDGKLPAGELSKHVASTVQEGIEKRFARTVELKKVASKSVEAGREFVAAYVDYVHYVEGIAKIAEGHGGHAHEGPGAHAAHVD